jgi:hypothetical protein
MADCAAKELQERTMARFLLIGKLCYNQVLCQRPASRRALASFVRGQLR